MSLPTRRATSRHRSFSIKPVGPMVPVSCLQCPASMTMRPIFRPRERLKDCWPSWVGSGMEGGPISSAWSCADFVLRAGFVFAEAGCAARGGVSGLLAAPAGGKDAESTFRSACAIWSLAGGTPADVDAVLSVRLPPFLDTGSRLGWGIGEEG